MVDYVTDTSSWEVWQRDYRLGLVLIMPPDEVAREIDSLRAKHDPRSHAVCSAHISVSDPLRKEVTEEAHAELRAILSSIEPFTLYFDKPEASSTRPGIAYPIRPQEPIDDLKRRLHTATVFAGEVYGRRDIPAHMTIAEFITIEASLQICSQLQNSAPSGSFLCDRLSFIVPNADFHFEVRDTFFLGGPLQR